MRRTRDGCSRLATSHGDIDLLILAERLEEAKSVVRSLGYTIEAQPMTFHKGAFEIRRLSKIDPSDGDLLMVDFLKE